MFVQFYDDASSLVDSFVESEYLNDAGFSKLRIESIVVLSSTTSR